MKKPPKPKIEKETIKDLLDPLDDYAESFVTKQINRIFSLSSIRNFFVAILATYLLINAEINISLSDANFVISPTTEFILTIAVLVIPIIGFSIIILLEKKQKEKWKKEKVNNLRVWSNFLKNIQPYIEDPVKRAQVSISILTEATSEDFRDVIIKTYGADIKKVIEDVETLKEDFSSIRGLAERARERKRQKN